jgi:acetyltransferase
MAVIYSAGFAEADEAGAHLQDKIVETARRHRIRVLGPNTLGMLRPQNRLNATSGVATQLVSGNVALVSQSGAVCSAMLDWSVPRHIGFSSMVSLGAAADVDFGDVLDFLALDAHTQCILLYVEGIRDARRFMSGLRAAARIKPVIVVKAGRMAAGSRAAKSHTGAWVGSTEVFRAVMERAGAVQVDALHQLFAAAHVFGANKRLGGDRIAIITNGGGPRRARRRPRRGTGPDPGHPLGRDQRQAGRGPAELLVPWQPGGCLGRDHGGQLRQGGGTLSGRQRGRWRGGHPGPPCP